MTGHPRHMAEFDRTGAGYLAKPFRLEQLRHEVRKRLVKAHRTAHAAAARRWE
jgi:hypothetical protein